MAARLMLPSALMFFFGTSACAPAATKPRALAHFRVQAGEALLFSGLAKDFRAWQEEVRKLASGLSQTDAARLELSLPSFSPAGREPTLSVSESPPRFSSSDTAQEPAFVVLPRASTGKMCDLAPALARLLAAISQLPEKARSHLDPEAITDAVKALTPSQSCAANDLLTCATAGYELWAREPVREGEATSKVQACLLERWAAPLKSDLSPPPPAPAPENLAGTGLAGHCQSIALGFCQEEVSEFRFESLRKETGIAWTSCDRKHPCPRTGAIAQCRFPASETTLVYYSAVETDLPHLKEACARGIWSQQPTP